MICGAVTAFAQSDAASSDQAAAGTETPSPNSQPAATSAETPAPISEAPTASAQAAAAPAAAPEAPAPNPQPEAAGSETSVPSPEAPAAGSEAPAPSPQPEATSPEISAPSEEAPAPSPEPAAASPQTPAATSESAAPSPTVPSTTSEPAAPSPEAPAASPETPATSSGAEEKPRSEADILAEITRLSAKLEEANGVIDELRTESYDLKNQAQDAEARAKAARDEADKADQNAAASEKKAAAAQAIADAADEQRKEAEAAAAKADALAADAERLKARVAELEAKIATLESGRDALYGKLASFGTLRIDPDSFPELLRSGFADGKTRLGTWKLAGSVLSQVDKNQYFSRLTFPLVQSAKPVLYSFETMTGSRGWVGTGIHLFAEGVKKPKGFGEGKSLLVWLTRDSKVRGNDGSYLQVYRSDSDVSMERVLDAKIKEKLDGWNRIDVLYEPANEFIVLAVNGTIRAAYRTYFGIGAGVTMSLRTLGAGVQFRNFEVRR